MLKNYDIIWVLSFLDEYLSSIFQIKDINVVSKENNFFFGIKGAF